jgi:hypothetical protein
MIATTNTEQGQPVQVNTPTKTMLANDSSGTVKSDAHKRSPYYGRTALAATS